MKYYQWRGKVIKISDNANFNNIVNKFRYITGITSIMIEEINPADIEDYIEYLESSNLELEKIIQRKEVVITRLQKNLVYELPY